MSRPVIGLTTYAEDARFGLHDTFSAVLPLSYVRAVHASGGRAVLITPDNPDPEVLGSLDGIVFTGGSDIDPSYYGEQPHPQTRIRPDRDRAELMLLQAAIDRRLPMLGICRGLQLMAVGNGGRLHQHVPDLGHRDDRPKTHPEYGQHPVILTPGSQAHAIVGQQIMVHSFHHHQGVADPGRLQITGRSPQDGLAEVVEDLSLPFAIGTQWHPEDSSDLRFFAALVTAAVNQQVSVG
jgi:putative glutamine amidotransferase